MTITDLTELAAHRPPHARCCYGACAVLLIAGLFTDSQVLAASTSDDWCQNRQQSDGSTTTPRTIQPGARVTGAVTEAALRIGRDFRDLWLISGTPLTPVAISVTGLDGVPMVSRPDTDDPLNRGFRLSQADLDFMNALPTSAGAGVRISEAERRITGRYIIPPSGRFPLSIGSAAECSGLNYELEVVGPSVPTPEDATFALLVGVATTGNRQLPALPGVRRDLQIIRDLLTKSAGIPSDRVLVLGDRDDNPATVSAFLDAMVNHLGRAGRNGTAILYFSGHGTTYEQNLALSSSPDMEVDGGDQALVFWDGWLVDDLLDTLLERLKARRRLVILDMCSASDATLAPDGELAAKSVPIGAVVNGFGRMMPSRDRPSRDDGRERVPTRTDTRDRVVLTAAEKGVKAFTGKSVQNPRPSVFTQTLAEALSRTLRDGTARTFEQVIRDDVYDRVLAETQRAVDSSQRVGTEGKQKTNAIGEYLRP